MSTKTNKENKGRHALNVFKTYTAFLLLLFIFSFSVLIISTIAAIITGIQSPVIHAIPFFILTSAFVGFGLCFYASLSGTKAGHSRRWQIIAVFAPISILPLGGTLHSIKYAIPSPLTPIWVTAMPVAALGGLTLATFLSIPWTFLDGRRTRGGEENSLCLFKTPLKGSESRQHTYSPVWRLTAGATVAGASLLAIYFTVKPYVSLVDFQATAIHNEEEQSLMQPAHSAAPSVTWNLSIPPSNKAPLLVAGLHGPVIIHREMGSIVQGLSEKDGSKLWHWKLNPKLPLDISTRIAETSPNRRYLALVINKYGAEESNYPEREPDIHPRVVVLDTETGNELWNMTVEGLERPSHLKLVLTNRVAVINQQVFHLTTGKKLWDLPDGNTAEPSVGAQETLLMVHQRDTYEPYTNPRRSDLDSCLCSGDSFTPVDDLTGHPKGPALTNILTGSPVGITASKGWILLHDSNTLTNTFHNVDSGRRIPAPPGSPKHLIEEDQRLPIEYDALALSFKAPSSPGTTAKKSNYIFDPNTTTIIHLGGSTEYTPPSSELRYLPYKENSALQADVFPHHSVPTLRLLEPIQKKILTEVTLWEMDQMRDRDGLIQIQDLVRTKNGWIIQIGSHHEDPTQILMIK